jgi:hypothetical protein
METGFDTLSSRQAGKKGFSRSPLEAMVGSRSLDLGARHCFSALLPANSIFLVLRHRSLPWLPNWHDVREAVYPSATIHSQPIALNRV